MVVVLLPTVPFASWSMLRSHWSWLLCRHHDDCQSPTSLDDACEGYPPPGVLSRFTAAAGRNNALLRARTMKQLTIDPSKAQPPTRHLPAGARFASSLPDAQETRLHPRSAGGENARILFVGTATTILYVPPVNTVARKF